MAEYAERTPDSPSAKSSNGPLCGSRRPV
jgi:hypothetical protein